ncbi:MAG: TetR/AcrR family transcriptional regulator [Methylocystaceae bacterium]
MHQYYWMDQLLDSQKDNMTDKQINIIKTAIELFSEKGYSATTTKEIAQRTGVSEGTIFKHYATKKDLMLSISEMIIRNIAYPLFTKGLDEVLNYPYESLDDFLSALMANRMARMQEGIPIFKLLVQEVPFQPEIRALVIEVFAQIPLKEGLERLRVRNLIIDQPTPETANFLLTSLFGYLLSRYIFWPELFADHMDADLENFLHFMARGLAAPAEGQTC